MKAVKLLTVAMAVALAAALSEAPARAGFGRQFYGAWQHNDKLGYWFCSHYYKPYADYPSYCYNYCIYYPASPKFIYYFNPYKSTYWGRYDVKTRGYSLLAERDRAGRLRDIPEKAFPKEAALPAVPDSKDQVQLAEPTDLPPGEKLKVGETAGQTAIADKNDDPLVPAPADKQQDLPPVDPKPGKPADAAKPNSPAAAPTPNKPAPAPGGAGPAAPANPTPAPGGPAPTVAPPPREVPAGPFFPGSCHPPFRGCPGHGYGW